jgi:hypothetical protein
MGFWQNSYSQTLARGMKILSAYFYFEIEFQQRVEPWPSKRHLFWESS